MTEAPKIYCYESKPYIDGKRLVGVSPVGARGLFHAYNVRRVGSACDRGLHVFSYNTAPAARVDVGCS